MEKFFSKIEEKFNKEMDNFEKSPVKTTIKWAITIYIMKKVWGLVKDEEK